MKIAIPRERRHKERRVAATPDTVKKFIALGADVVVERGAGLGASILDADYEAAGATIAADAATTYAGADLIFKVRAPLRNGEGELDEVALLPQGATLAAILDPYGDRAGLQALADAGVQAFSMEFMPRISRAQSMDVLSSQSNLAGYKAVIDAAATFGRAFPMMMTAAGTVAPAKVFVMGAGVAGLQAVATAKRLGAVISATDVRPAVGEQVESLGGKFIMVESDEAQDAETSGGYAKEMSDEYKAKQAELIAATITKQDIVITTALIPGRAAPVLVTDDHIASMKPGSVIIDLAAEQGGNVTQSRLGETVTTDNGVIILGPENIASRLAADTSALYARNILNFAGLFIDAESKSLAFDYEDEIITGTLVTRDGAIVHPNLKEA